MRQSYTLHFMVVNGWKTIHFESKFPFLCFGTLFDVFSLDMVINFSLNFTPTHNYKTM